MKYIYTGKNVDVKSDVKDYVEKKFSRIARFFRSEPEADITLSTQKKMWIFEVTIVYKGFFFRAEEAFDDVFAAIDKAEDVIERQIRKYRTKLEKRLYEGNGILDIEEAEDISEEDEEFQIIRRKSISSKPMDTEEAILQMNMLGHEFFMYMNAETEQINVVYRRKDGNYGLIEAE